MSEIEPSREAVLRAIRENLQLGRPAVVAHLRRTYADLLAEPPPSDPRGAIRLDRLGAICCKGTTLKPRIGNPTPRVTETPGGMLNSIGLQNPGVDAVIEKYAATWATWKVPVLVNVAGERRGEVVVQ
jgi:hypothetical protein